MKRKHKAYLRVNLVSLAFVVVSFMSVTLAWFAYSGLSTMTTEASVKAWYIELERNGSAVSNDIVISLDEIYPGMDPINEVVKIKNLGDSDAQVKYSIVSARILGNPIDNYVVDETTTSEYVEDKLSHDYPFNININLSKGYALSKIGESNFEVSVSWPLDSGNDTFDSEWGSAAYQFQQSEQNLKNENPSYQVKPCIQFVISVTAEQYIESDISSDVRYNLGDEILYDVNNNTVCDTLSSTCLKTHVIDTNNQLSDQTVTLLPEVTGEYQSSTFSNYNTTIDSIVNGWSVTTRNLSIEDVLKVVSLDINHSYLAREGVSNSIIGNLNYEGRITTELNKAITSNGNYTFNNSSFPYLNSDSCYWTDSANGEYGFAIKNLDENTSKIYTETSVCKVVPVIVANKYNL